MQFRRSGQRDERRRKVLLDDSADAAAKSAAGANSADRSDVIAKAYAAAAADEAETRVADLVPTRPLGVLIMFLTGLAAVASVQTLYSFLPRWQAALGPEGAAALDIAARDSLAGWLSSVMLGLSAVTAVLVYAIRRHKMDDYRGRYRLWLWCAAGLMLASVNAVAGLHHVFDAVVVSQSGIENPLRGISWSVAAAAACGAVLGGRVLMDVWRSRICSLALVTAAACYAGWGALAVFSPLAEPVLAAMTHALVASLAHLMLLFSLVLYARHVLLEVRGLLPAKTKKKKKPGKRAPEKAAGDDAAKKNHARSKSGRTLKIDPPHNQTGGTKRTDLDAAESASQEEEAGTSGDDGPVEGSPEWAKLSKAQRRRLKKQRRKKAV